MPTTYAHAPEVRRLAEGLIGKHHTRLADVRIEYLFRSKAAKTHGKVMLGKARKLSGLNAFLARNTEAAVEDMPGDEFFVVEIAEDEWAHLGKAQRVALVDHELCHLTVEHDEETDELTLGLKAHDVEEFAQVLERHGAWNDDVKQLVAVVQQLDLGMDDGPEQAG